MEYPSDRLILNWMLGYAQACKEHDEMIDPDVIINVVAVEWPRR